MTLQGHPMSLILAPIKAHSTSIVTLVLSCRVSEILRLFVRRKPLFRYPTPIRTKISGVPQRHVGVAKSEHLRLTNREIIFEKIPTYVITIHQRHRQTDGQTTCDRKTALCTVVHRVVKNIVYIIPIYSVSQKNPHPYGFLKFFPKRLGIFNQFFTHLLCDDFYTRLQIFIQLSPTLTKLCHTKRDHPSNFLHFTRT